jgi:HEAT repeat protein
MLRSLLFLLGFTLLPAAAFDLEKWVEDLGNKQMERWRKEAMRDAVKARDPKDRIEALERLPYTDADVIAVFAIALSDPDARVRKAAASQLWSAAERAEPYRPQLTKALDDPDANVVAYAAGALQATGVKAAELAAPRKRVLTAPDASVTARFLVARSLVGYEPPMNLVGPMIAYLEQNTRNYTGSVTDGNRENVELAQHAMEHLVKDSKERALIAPLSRALAETRNGQIPVMKALAAFDPRPEGWTRMLLAQLENPNSRVRDAALGHFRGIKDEKEIAVWVPRAAQMLQDPDYAVRSEALWALGSAKGLAAGELDKVVAALSSDAHPTVRRSAARALEDIAEANQAIPAATRARLATVARPALEAALQDPDNDVRRAAQSALRNVVGRDSPPATVAVAAPSTAAPSESAGMAVLRARKVAFEPKWFYRALSEMDVELIRAFLDAGMSPSASVVDNGPPMRVMLSSSNACAPNARPTRAETKAMVKLLLERGADVNVGDSNRNTAIIEAAGKGCDRELMRMLIKAGAQINVPNASGLTPFEMGLHYPHDGLEELIAAGYRMPPDKVKMYLENYKDRPAVIAWVKKAMARK